MDARFPRFLLLWSVLAAGGLRAAEPRTVVFFGDSLTAGYGLDDPASEAYPALIQQKIDAARLPWRVVNAGLSGETTSGGLRRVEWILRQPAGVFVVALGANDGLRGIEPAVSRANLHGIIDRVRARYPAATIVLAGMRMPPTMGEDYAREFATIYADIAREEHLTFVPFLLAGVGDEPVFNQPDGIHPTARGHALVAATVWPVLQPLLR
jgi:acyl-CoA thioesterase-1